MRTNDISALWSWPWDMAQAGLAWAEMWQDASTVVAARTPIMQSALGNPLSADTRELSSMVTEKAEAFGQSQRTMIAAADKVRAAAQGNARDLGRLTGGGMLLPTDLMRMAERNLSAFAALTALPGQAVAPIQRSASANARRLRG